MSNPVGRPLKFKSVEELQEKINEYFTYCDNRVKKVWSEKKQDELLISDPEPYTMSGLAVFLGVDRQTILNYSEKEEFFGTIKEARSKVESDVERRMNDKNTFTPGLIFNAKNNFNWKDKTESEVTGKDGEPLGVVILPPIKNEYNMEATSGPTNGGTDKG